MELMLGSIEAESLHEAFKLFVMARLRLAMCFVGLLEAASEIQKWGSTWASRRRRYKSY